MELYVDGATKHNGKIAKQKSYIAVTDNKSNVLIDEFVGSLSNNQTEAQAIFEALRYLSQNNLKDGTIFSDSQLIVKGITGKLNIRSPKLAPIVAVIRDLMAETGTTIKWLRRNKNLAGIYLERKYSKGWREYWPRPQKRYKSTLSSATQLSIGSWVRWLNRQTNLNKIDEYRVFTWWIKSSYKEGNIAEVHEALKEVDEVLKFIRSNKMKHYRS